MNRFTAVILLFVCSQAFAYKNEPDGFRGINWQDPLEIRQSELELVEKGETTDFYSRKGDHLKIGDATLDSILYGYSQYGLSSVMIRSSGYQNKKALSETFNTQFGKGYQNNRYIERYLWSGETTTILLNCHNSRSDCIVTFFSKAVARIQDAELKKQATEAAKDF